METEAGRAAFVQAAVARALIRAFGMVAENAQRAHRDESMSYSQEDFDKLIAEEGIGHNDVVNALRGWTG